jgi:hypothetical protein
MEGGLNLVQSWLNTDSMVTVSRIVRELQTSHEHARDLLKALVQQCPGLRPISYSVSTTAKSSAGPTLYGVVVEGREGSLDDEMKRKREVYRGEGLVYPIAEVGILQQDSRSSNSSIHPKPIVNKTSILKQTPQATEKKNLSFEKPAGNIANMIKSAPKLSTDKKAVGFEKPAESSVSTKESIKRQSTPHPMKTKKESQNLSEFLHSNPMYTIEEDTPMEIEEPAKPEPKKRKAKEEPNREVKKMKVETTNKENNQTRVIRVRKTHTVVDENGRITSEDVYEEQVVPVEPIHAIPSKKGTQTNLANFFVRK